MPNNVTQDGSETAIKHHELIKLEITVNSELRKAGIENGSKGVRGAFSLYAFIFISNAVYAHFNADSRLLDMSELIWLAGILSLTLLAYFGFIFKYTVAAKFDKGNLTFGTQPGSQRPDDAA